MAVSSPSDTTTRYQGVYARHRSGCRLGHGGARCTCKPRYWGRVWDPARGKGVKTKLFPTAAAAYHARIDMAQRLRDGEAASLSGGLRLQDARDRFVTAAREGKGPE